MDSTRPWTGIRRSIQSNDAQTNIAGLLERRVGWKLTWRGWLLLLVLFGALLIAFLLGAYPFLAPTDRVPSDLLVVEGWMPHYSMKDVAQEFLTHHYERVVLVCSIIDIDDKYESGRDEGENLKDLLEKYHVPRSKITVLFPFVVKKDRTYHSALALKDWLASHGPPENAFDVVTMGPHARRTRLLYEKAFGPGKKIGIIANEDRLYDKSRWWRASEGVRSVLDESIAYLYARLLFRPGT